MPDLHEEAVHAFWDSYDRRVLYRIIVALEHVEHWTLDHIPEVEEALVHLGEVMDHPKDFELTNEATLIQLLAQTSASRALRMLQALDIVKPGIASQLLMYAEEKNEDDENQIANPYAKLFLKRNLVFERLQLLLRIFAPQRISLILKALEQSEDQ